MWLLYTALNFLYSTILRCGVVWSSFQHEKETLVEQINDLEKKMAMFTTAKAASVHEAEDKCQRYQVRRKQRRKSQTYRNH